MSGENLSDLFCYDYVLPPELIAQEPLPNRTDARLLVVNRQTQTLEHRHIRDLPSLLNAEDVLVINDTKVLPARLVGKRLKTGGKWEGLFLQTVPPNLWKILGKTGGKIQTGETVRLLSPDYQKNLMIVFVTKNDDGSWLVLPEDSQTAALTLLEQIGTTPLPPYIRKGQSAPADKERYQTVYASRSGAIAAPTAGLHFTPELLNEIKKAGTAVVPVTLHVGAGTFKSITAENIEKHNMHAEWCRITDENAAAVLLKRKSGGRIVAVGTTSMRVLESASAAAGTLQPYEGETSLFIRPPYAFKSVDMLLTNFHFPKSTLLVLVRTFGGDELIKAAYEEAIRQKYRFFSYGDAMLIV